MFSWPAAAWQAPLPTKAAALLLGLRSSCPVIVTPLPATAPLAQGHFTLGVEKSNVANTPYDSWSWFTIVAWFSSTVAPHPLSPWLLAGPLFEWVSCPHYLAEIIIYCGLALVTGGSINSLLMLVWVVSWCALPWSVLGCTRACEAPQVRGRVHGGLFYYAWLQGIVEVAVVLSIIILTRILNGYSASEC